MKRTVSQISILLGIWILFLNCTCAIVLADIEEVELEYKNSAVVFVGNVTSLYQIKSNYDWTYEIEVCEVFKGELNPGENLVGKFNPSCEPYIDSTGKWVLFGHLGDHFTANTCGLSYYINNPRFLNPPSTETGKEFKTWNVSYEEWLKHGKDAGDKILTYLRKIKTVPNTK